MFDDYELFQGAVLRQLIVDADCPIAARPFVDEGRISAFVLNERVGIFLKHSSKRMPPWGFTLRATEVEKVLQHLEKQFATYMLFICGRDGVAALDMSMLRSIIDFEETDSAWIRVERKRRSMYGVSGNRGALPHKVSRGADPIFESLRTPRSGC